MNIAAEFGNFKPQGQVPVASTSHPLHELEASVRHLVLQELEPTLPPVKPGMRPLALLYSSLLESTLLC